MDNQVIKGALPGSADIDTDNEWITSKGFLFYLEYFCTRVILTSQNPILLIQYKYVSHVYFQAIRLCRERNITMLWISSL
jgi:hypothetical protein